MSKTLKRVLAIALSVFMMFSYCTVAFAGNSNDEEPIAAEFEVVYDENGNRIGFKTIRIGDKTFYDVFGGKNTADNLSLANFYKGVLSGKYDGISALDIWSHVADDVFRIGGPKFGYNYEYGNYDTWFSADRTNTSDEDNIANGDIELQQYFSGTSDYTSGPLEYHSVRGTGLQFVNSLSAAQDMMLDQITEICGEENDAEIFQSEVLKYCTPGGDGHDLLNNTTERPVLANVVTTQYDKAGLERYFSSFGMVYYDFKLVPIANENLEYITAADDYESVEDAFKNGAPGVSYVTSDNGETTMSYLQNPTANDASVNASTSTTTSYSVSNSFTKSDSFTFGRSDTLEVSGKLPALDFKVVSNVSLSTAISTAYSDSTSVSDSVTTSSSVNVNLPAYTEVAIKQTTSTTEQSVEYNCPVYVTYKVIIFGMNGEYRQGSGDGAWNDVDYDQGGICVGFGTDSTMGGVDAVENLSMRLEENSMGFEKAFGNVSGVYEDQLDGNDPELLSYIDWSSSSAVNDLEKWAEYATYNIPMSSLGGKMVVKSQSVNSEIAGILPLYDLKRIRFEDTSSYNLAIGGTLDLNAVTTVGLNEFDHEYYGFLPRMGTWHICDAEGNDITYEDGKGITLEPTPSTQIIVANEIGNYYVRFDIDENYYTKASDRSEFITNDDLEIKAILKLVVTDTGNNHECRPGAWVTYIPSNCLVEGERYKYCLTCSKRMAVEVIPKADHVPVEITEAPTCQSAGSTTVTCAVCRAVLSSSTTEKLEHTPGSWVTQAATCTSDGSKTRSCMNCSTVLESEVIPATGHNAQWLTKEEATCTKYGREENTCMSCNAVLETRRIEKESHIPGKWEIILPSSCTQSGLMQQCCATCGGSVGELVTIAPHDHQPGSWVTTIKPDCEQDGEKVQNCTVCKGTIATETIPALGHTDGVWVTVLEGTCEIEGVEHLLCTRCGHIIDERLTGTTDHSFTVWNSQDGSTHSRSCEDCGTVECDECDYVKTVIDPTCTEGGQTSYECSLCGDSYTDTATAALGHNWGEWTESQNGFEERVCLTCGETENQAIKEDFDLSFLKVIRGTAVMKTYKGENYIAIVMDEGRTMTGIYKDTTNGGTVEITDIYGTLQNRDSDYMAYQSQNSTNPVATMTITYANGTTDTFPVVFELFETEREISPDVIKNIRPIRGNVSVANDEKGDYILVEMLEGQSSVGVYKSTADGSATAVLEDVDGTFTEQEKLYIFYGSQNTANPEGRITITEADGTQATYRVVFKMYEMDPYADTAKGLRPVRGAVTFDDDGTIRIKMTAGQTSVGLYKTMANGATYEIVDANGKITNNPSSYMFYMTNNTANVTAKIIFTLPDGTTREQKIIFDMGLVDDPDPIDVLTAVRGTVSYNGDCIEVKATEGSTGVGINKDCLVKYTITDVNGEMTENDSRYYFYKSQNADGAEANINFLQSDGTYKTYKIRFVF